MNDKVKTLYIDIETSYNIIASWGLWPKFIPHDNVLQEWHIICVCWKWADKDRVYSARTYDQNDRAVVQEVKDVIEQADEIVYHNGDKFDFKKLQARAMVNSIPPIVKPLAVDTLKQARKHFALTCNRLDYIGQLLGVGEKMDTSNELWLKALQGNKRAIDYMVKYCKQDVLLLERVHKRMKPYLDVGVNRAVSSKIDDVCPRCGKEKSLQKMGFRMTKTARYQRYRCVKCGSTCSGQENLNKGTKPVR